ncbi:hypothetical protein JCM19047_4302 [Bacillus sp. JCM 19047]|nr:hypothetical protein JCM19047_4302 [Bacillus sp. JCM 19047]
MRSFLWYNNDNAFTNKEVVLQMEMNGLMGGVYRIAEWIMRLAAINLLWILFTVGGLVVGGLFPATQAAFAVTRQWIRGETDLPIFKTFVHYFKKDYLKVQIMGLCLTIIGFVLYIDLVFIYQSANPYVQLLAFPLLILTFIYILTCFYAFSAFVHYELSVFKLLKHAALHTVVRPFLSIGMLITCAGVLFLMFQFPGVLPFFGVSIPIFLLMWFSHTGLFETKKNKRVKQLNISCLINEAYRQWVGRFFFFSFIPFSFHACSNRSRASGPVSSAKRKVP